MKTLRAIAIVLLVSLFSGCSTDKGIPVLVSARRTYWHVKNGFLYKYRYDAIVLNRSIARGEIIQQSDISEMNLAVWQNVPGDWVTDPKSVVGHRTLRPIHGNTQFHMSEISAQ